MVEYEQKPPVAAEGFNGEGRDMVSEPGFTSGVTGFESPAVHHLPL